MYGIYPRCYEAKPSNPNGIPYTTASEESMWLVPQLTAFHQSQAEKSIPLGNTFGFRQLREQMFEKCGLCPITLHFSRAVIGGRQATVVQLCLIPYTLTNSNCFRRIPLVWIATQFSAEHPIVKQKRSPIGMPPVSSHPSVQYMLIRLLI